MRGLTSARQMWRTAVTVALALAWISAGVLSAHDSPEHVVEWLTARMEAGGRRPDLLWRRATEYRALGDLAAAEKDLRAALRGQRELLQARVDLSRVQMARGKTNAALRTIDAAGSARTAPEVRMVRAEILEARGRLGEAVVECDRALADVPVANPEWYLARSQLLFRLGRLEEAANGLGRGVELTSNAVLEAEWIDAMIDAGQWRVVRPRIEAGLAESRCQASWLIRRGRAWAAQGMVGESQADFLAAVSELNRRLRPGRPDFSLLAERGLAYALLGDLDLARNDLARARECGADSWTLQRLERRLAAVP